MADPSRLPGSMLQVASKEKSKGQDQANKNLGESNKLPAWEARDKKIKEMLKKMADCSPEKLQS